MSLDPQGKSDTAVDGLQLVGSLCRYPKLLEELGASPDAVCRLAGLGVADLADPAALIPFSTFGKLLVAGCEATGREDIGLLIGARAELRLLGPVGDFMLNAPTLRQALEDLARQHTRYIRGAAVYLLPDGLDMAVGYTIYQAPASGLDLVSDAVAAAALRYVQELAGDTTGAEILLSRMRPSNVQPWSGALGVPVRFNCEHTAVFIPRRLLDVPVLGADPARRNALEVSIRSYMRVRWPLLAERLQREVRVRLMLGRSVLRADLAREMDMSERSLNRRLAMEGRSFQSVLSETRRHLAEQLLADTDIDIGRIALAVGFAEHSAFSRAFNSWTDTSAVAWRARSRTG